MAFDIKKLKPREKKLVGILIVIFSTIPFFQFTLPAWNEFIDISSKIKNNKGKIKDIDERIGRLEKLKKENLDLSNKIESQKSFLAKSYELDFLVQDLKKICDESLISLESFTPTNPEPVNIIVEKQAESEGFGSSRSQSQVNLKQLFDKLGKQDLPIDLYSLPIEVRVNGNFTDVLELFKKLEAYRRVISVENISIGKIQVKQTGGNRLSKKAKKQTTETGGLYGTFDLIAYNIPQKEEKIPVSQIKKSIGSTGSSFKIKRL